MNLTDKEIKFLTIMNETRLCDGKLFKRDSEQFSKVFAFDEGELEPVVNKLVSLGLLSEMDLGGGEKIYFHTKKVSKISLSDELMGIKH